MKSTLNLLTSFLLITNFIYAQNPPSFNLPVSDTIIVFSGQNCVPIANIDTGDSLAQNIQIEVVSENEMLINIDSVSFSNGDKVAVIWLTEQGITGTANLSVSLTDKDGTTTKQMEIVISRYTHHGVKFEIHDAVFWQEVVPADATPVFDSIVQTTNMKAVYDRLNWDKIDLTVSAGCDNPTLCDGHDFGTGFLKGFIMPEISGDYNLYINGDADYALFLSSNEDFENATAIAAKSDNHGKIGSEMFGRKSAPMSLTAGSVYAFYAVQWNIHNENGGVQWELPGQIGRQYIGSENLYPAWDTERPTVPQNVSITQKGDDFLKIGWQPASDNQNLTGYKVYVNGILWNKTPLKSNHVLLTGLSFETFYSLAVTAVDEVGNESFFSTIQNTTTFAEDTVPPTPPTSLIVDEAGGLALKISWDGANDDKTGIFGYRVFLNGKIQNADSLLSGNSMVLKVLEPQTTYSVRIEAVDGGMNVSEKSQDFRVTTTAFDPLADNLGLKTGRFDFSEKAISFNEGIGINPDFKNGAMFNSAQTRVLNDLQPGAIRWGALTANPLSFKDYTGAGKSVTIGKFISRCNQLNAATVFCCGVKNNTDWMQNDDIFIRFLEYINGPDETLGGKIRLTEGVSEPFLKNSRLLIFEFGNEVWGGNAHNAEIGENYNEYAAWCRRIANKMRASEYFDSTKIKLVYSARYPSREKSYGLNDKIIDGDTGEVDWIAPSGYIGGNLDYDPAFPPAKSELDYYQNVKDRADSYLQGIVESHQFEVQKTGRIFKQYMYESNTTTPTYNGRLGQAILSTDYYLTCMELGSVIPTIFHLTGGQWRITEPENNYRPLPLFLTAKQVNRFCKGDVLDNTYSANNGSVSKTGATFAKRPVGIHSYRNSSGYTVVFASRDFENDHFVQLVFPENFSFNKKGELFTITGNDYNTKFASIDSSDISISDKMIIKVPKSTMLYLRIFSDSLQMKNLPLGFYDYPRMESLRIYAPKNQFTKANERLAFRVYIEPTNSWDQKVEWSLVNNSGNYTFDVNGSFCYVYSGNQVSNAGDSLILRVANRPGDVYDEVVIYTPKTPVGTVQNQKPDEFELFPNPAGDSVTIRVSESKPVQIFSLSGMKILEQKLQTGINRINLNVLPRGIYSVNIAGQIKKLVKSN